MNNFAVIDDSRYIHDDIHVYSHALILCEELAQVKIFTGDNKSIFTHEKELYDFIAENLPVNYRLYACTHYKLYDSIWNGLVFEEFHRKLSRNIKRHFDCAHNTARAAVKNYFLE